MDDDTVRPEIMSPTERVADIADLLKEHNALLKRYGPSIEQFVEMAKRGATPGRLGLADYFGQALAGGKLDGLLGDVRSIVRRSAGLPDLPDPTAPNPPRRRRRR